jgi:hypothetical protein
MIEPAMWPTRFIYQQSGQADGNTLYNLHAIDDSSLTDATVGLGPKWCAREVQADYADGKFKNYTFDAEPASTAQRNAGVAP